MEEFMTEHGEILISAVLSIFSVAAFIGAVNVFGEYCVKCIFVLTGG